MYPELWRPVRKPAEVVTLLAWLALWLPTIAQASLDPAKSALCYDAISRASARSGTPTDVMLAISLTETGKTLGGQTQPWPWTVNMEGKGLWFATRGEAEAYVKKEFARGARSFDVGCFQINYKWHHQHFRSIEDMFDPQVNAAYAARFLNSLHRETGDWSRAAGAYHSRTRKYAERYRARFDRYRARIAGKPLPAPSGGHGSEPLQLAATEPARAPVERKLLEIGRQTPLLSSASQLGSLVGSSGGGGGLLRRSAGSLF